MREKWFVLFVTKTSLFITAIDATTSERINRLWSLRYSDALVFTEGFPLKSSDSMSVSSSEGGYMARHHLVKNGFCQAPELPHRLYPGRKGVIYAGGERKDV